jgi:hypothetical protein
VLFPAEKIERLGIFDEVCFSKQILLKIFCLDMSIIFLFSQIWCLSVNVIVIPKLLRLLEFVFNNSSLIVQWALLY